MDGTVSKIMQCYFIHIKLLCKQSRMSFPEIISSVPADNINFQILV